MAIQLKGNDTSTYSNGATFDANVETTGTFVADRTDGNSQALLIRRAGNQTAEIKADGSATFENPLRVNRSVSGNLCFATFTGGTNTAATSVINSDGDASFHGDIMVGAQNAIQLYNTGTIVSAGTYSTTAPSPRSLFVGNDGVFGGVSSVRASKKNINYDYDSSWVLDLQPVSFNYRKQDEETQAYIEEAYEEGQYGLIAEDVEEVNREICNYDGDKLLGVEYMKLITPILSQLKQANARIEALEAQLAQLTGGAN